VVREDGTEGGFSWLFGIARVKDAFVVDDMKLLNSFT
jgi:hypothetical protein